MAHTLLLLRLPARSDTLIGLDPAHRRDGAAIGSHPLATAHIPAVGGARRLAAWLLGKRGRSGC